MSLKWHMKCFYTKIKINTIKYLNYKCKTCKPFPIALLQSKAICHIKINQTVCMHIRIANSLTVSWRFLYNLIYNYPFPKNHFPKDLIIMAHVPIVIYVIKQYNSMMALYD